MGIAPRSRVEISANAPPSRPNGTRTPSNKYALTTYSLRARRPDRTAPPSELSRRRSPLRGTETVPPERPKHRKRAPLLSLRQNSNLVPVDCKKRISTCLATSFVGRSAIAAIDAQIDSLRPMRAVSDQPRRGRAAPQLDLRFMQSRWQITVVSRRDRPSGGLVSS